MGTYKIKKPVRLIEFFAGIGSQAMALRDLSVDFTAYLTSEWDVNAIKSYKAIHFPDDHTDYSKNLSKEEIVTKLNEIGISSDGKKPMEEQQIKRRGEKWLRETYNNCKAIHNIGSITNIHAEDLKIKDKDSYVYLLTYSFPCTDISLAGQQKGFDKGSNTHSSLLWEVERILNECKENNCLPDILLMENVSAIHNKKNMPNFQIWLDSLRELGYSSYWQDMNSKNYGIAQNRERTFVVSLLGGYPYNAYIFSGPIVLNKRLKDYLESQVDEKYYINSEKANKLIGDLIDRGVLPREIDREREREREREELTFQLMNQNSEISQIVSKQDMTQESVTISKTGQESSHMRIDTLGYIEKGTGKHQSNTVYSSNGLSLTLYAGMYRNPFMYIEDNEKK